MSAEAAQRSLANILLAARPAVAVSTLESLAVDGVIAVLLEQPIAVAAAVLEHMVPEQAARVMSGLGERGREIVATMSPPRAAIAVAWLGDEERNSFLQIVGGSAERELRELLSYPEGTAGSLMDPRVFVARRTDTAAEALARIGDSRTPLYQISIVDDEHRLVGVVPIQRLAIAPRDQAIAPLVTDQVESVDAFTHRDEVAALLSSTATPSIAVVDAEGHLLGVLRHRMLLGIAEDDAASRMQQMVGVSRDERALSPIGFAVKKRLPWLNVNLLTAFLAAAVVGVFEGTIAKVTSLAVLLPVVAGQSGNSGSQALAVTMRGLALREIRPSHWPKVAFKELFVGLTNGVAIALVTGASVWLWSGNLMLAAVIAASMVVSMSAAGVAGASVPIVMQQLGQDPAQASSIILTTVTDVVGFSSFLGLATILSHYLV